MQLYNKWFTKHCTLEALPLKFPTYFIQVNTDRILKSKPEV